MIYTYSHFWWCWQHNTQILSLPLPPHLPWCCCLLWFALYTIHFFSNASSLTFFWELEVLHNHNISSNYVVGYFTTNIAFIFETFNLLRSYDFSKFIWLISRSLSILERSKGSKVSFHTIRHCIGGSLLQQ